MLPLRGKILNVEKQASQQLACCRCRLRYHGSAAAASAALPYDAGFESVGVVVAAASDTSAGVWETHNCPHPRHMSQPSLRF